MFATHYTDSRGHAREIAARLGRARYADLRAELVKRPPQAK